MITSATKKAPWRDREARQRADAHSGKILAMLAAAGNHGCTNSQLWAVCHAVNSRISDLRRRGYKITAESEGGGVWRYRLISSPAFRPSPFEQLRRREEAEAMPLFAGDAA
jgi:hypothetical protein